MSDISAIGGYGIKIDGKYETLEDLKQTVVEFTQATPELGAVEINTVRDMARAIDRLYTHYSGKKTILRKIKDLKDCLQALVEKICGVSDYSAVYMNDNHITSYVQLECVQNGWSDIDELDRLMTYSKALKRDRVRVYDISRQKYDKYDSDDGRHFIKSQISGEYDVRYTDDFLGIVPVFTSPINAMFFQNILNLEYLNEISSNTLSGFPELYSPAYNSISGFLPMDFKYLRNGQTYGHECGPVPEQCLSSFGSDIVDYLLVNLSSDGYDKYSLSQIAAKMFPAIEFKNRNHYSTRYLKHIGVTVFKAFRDRQNNGKINFRLLESFVGSLDPADRDPITNGSTFIDTIVNQNSNFIRLFSNAAVDKLRKASTIAVSRQPAYSLGFYGVDCRKDISFEKSMSTALTTALDRIRDPNVMPLDIIVDAGVSNIAQLVKKMGGRVNFDDSARFSDFQIDDFAGATVDLSGWKSVLDKLDNHCRNIRKDCIFIADGVRSFCVEGDQPLVRKTKTGSSVEKDILPRLRYMQGVTSSYSSGYCDWFYVQDRYTNMYFWCPPSIKAAGVYAYCDTYFHPWSAPAGMTRGVIDAVDVAFTPTEPQAGRVYNQQWNYAISYPIEGIVLEGQKTFQTAQTALDRINVRRLMLYLEKRVRQISRRFLYEGNTEYNRQRFVDLITPIFDDAKNGYGISEYAIKCDADINTAEAIENHELHCRIAVKPIKSIEYIICSFIVTNQSMSVQEEVQK